MAATDKVAGSIVPKGGDETTKPEVVGLWRFVEEFKVPAVKGKFDAERARELWHDVDSDIDSADFAGYPKPETKAEVFEPAEGRTYSEGQRAFGASADDLDWSWEQVGEICLRSPEMLGKGGVTLFPLDTNMVACAYRDGPDKVKVTQYELSHKAVLRPGRGHRIIVRKKKRSPQVPQAS